MGSMRFRVLPPERFTADMVEQAYLSGMDRMSWPVETEREDDELILDRSVSDSGNLNVPWPIAGRGTLMLATASLIERFEPYLMPLELARGSIVQVRNQLADWQTMGLTIPAAVSSKLAEAAAQFSRAAVDSEDPLRAARRAEAALALALDAGDLLSDAYAEQALAVHRYGNGGGLTTLLGADLGPGLLDSASARHFLHIFNCAEVPLRWRDVETAEDAFNWANTDKQIAWCRKFGLKVVAGPLLTFDPHDLPDWLYLFEDDFESMVDFVGAFVRAAVDRYRGQVDYWICAGRVNALQALALAEPERLRLVAQTIDLVHSMDSSTPVLVSFDQPWAAYMRRQETDFPPLHFADALIRAGLDLGGLMLEMNVGYWPGGTLLRPPLEFSRLLDSWTMLGQPLWLSVCVPSADGADPQSRHTESMPPAGWTAADQQAWASRFVPMALAKPLVAGVVWNQYHDGRPHDFAHGGLIAPTGKPKPALGTLARLRHTHWPKQADAGP